MIQGETQPLILFYSYSIKDDRLREELETHLASLGREGIIKDWHFRMISPGAKWENIIDEHLENANIILLLISPNFINSDYCYGKEMKRALQKHKAGEAIVIPVILRPCEWKRLSIGTLQALPNDGKPVTKWSNRDEAWKNVVSSIRKAIEDNIIAIKSKDNIVPETRPKIESNYPVYWYVIRKSSDGDMLEDMCKYPILVFLGISQSNLKAYFRSLLREAGAQYPWRSIHVFYASFQEGEMWQGTQFKNNVKTARHEIAIELTNPGLNKKIPNFAKLTFHQYKHRSTFGGCMMSSGDKSCNIIYVVNYLPTEIPYLEDSLTFKIETEKSNNIADLLSKIYCTAYCSIFQNSISLGVVESSLWDQSVKQWAAFCETCNAQMGSMKFLAREFARFKGDEKVIDIGAGTGHISKILLKEGFPKGQLTVLDASPQMLQSAKNVLRNYSNVKYALCRVPSPLDEFIIDLNDKYNAIVIHLALPAVAGDNEELFRLANWCKKYLTDNGKIILCAHNTAVEIDSSPFNIDDDPLRQKIRNVAFEIGYGDKLRKLSKMRFSQKGIENIFKKAGFILERRQEKSFPMSMEDRTQMWRAPAVLNDVLDVATIPDEQLQFLIEQIDRIGGSTPDMVIMYWFFNN